MTAGAAGAVAISQLAKRTPTPLFAIGQALTPVLAGVAVPAAVVGLVTRRPALTACATASAVTVITLSTCAEVTASGTTNARSTSIAGIVGIGR